MEFFLDENTVKTLKPFGVAAIGLAAIAGIMKIIKQLHLHSINFENKMKINNMRKGKCHRRENQLGYIMKVIHVL